jgi:hypothetical protein
MPECIVQYTLVAIGEAGLKQEEALAKTGVL